MNMPRVYMNNDIEITLQQHIRLFLGG